ncbi:hypothetical protein [Salinispora vitiensis]|uniref:hypothetical protein n=1 Tax=Salinispora vitiensis TaxID=999544 RepID=UPI0003625152|nr:hypothetical protein [Salinispora vitiensis]
MNEQTANPSPPSEALKRVSDRAAAYIRTVWPMALGHVAALVAAYLAARSGIRMDETWLIEVMALAAGAAIYAAGRWLEQRTGTSGVARSARWLGRWVLSIGIHTGTPVYVPPAGTGR